MAVDGWLPSAKRAHIWTFPQLTTSGIIYMYSFEMDAGRFLPIIILHTKEKIASSYI
jgi:hypothetical protein